MNASTRSRSQTVTDTPSLNGDELAFANPAPDSGWAHWQQTGPAGPGGGSWRGRQLIDTDYSLTHCFSLRFSSATCAPMTQRIRPPNRDENHPACKVPTLHAGLPLFSLPRRDPLLDDRVVRDGRFPAIVDCYFREHVERKLRLCLILAGIFLPFVPALTDEHAC